MEQIRIHWADRVDGEGGDEGMACKIYVCVHFGKTPLALGSENKPAMASVELSGSSFRIGVRARSRSPFAVELK